MKRLSIVSIVVWLLSGQLLGASPASIASGFTSDAFLDEVNLPETVVSAERADRLSGSFHVVASISTLDIESLPVSTLPELLTYLPGLDIRQRGAAGTQTDISMRGGTFDQVLVLLNGVPINDAQTGHYTMNIPIPLSLIERIDVLESCGAAVFGVNAFTGAINIVTRQTDTLYYARLSGGMNGLVHPELTASFQTKTDCHVNLGAEYNHADGYYAPSPSEKEKKACENSDFRIANIYTQVIWRGLDVQLGAQYKDVGAGMYYGFGSQDQFDATRTGFVSARYQKSWNVWSIDVQGSYRINKDHYQWHRNQELYSNRHLSHNAALSVKGAYASRIGRTSIGVEVRNEHLKSTNLGDTANGNNRLLVNYLAAQSFVWGDFSAGVGVAGHYSSDFGHDFTGSVNLGYRYDKDGQVYVNANRALRLPTFTDLFYNAGNQLGNPNLQPETAWNLSLGTKWSRSFAAANPSQNTLSLGADGWFRWSENSIDWVYVADDAKRPYHAANHNRVRSAGMEAYVRYRWNEWIPCVSLSYAYTWLDLDLIASGSRYLDYLRHHLTFHLEHGIWHFGGKKGSLGASWTLSFRERIGQYNNADGQVSDYKPVLLLDGQLFWQNPTIKISAECTNITNRHYYDYGGILQPGAWAKGTITVKL